MAFNKLRAKIDSHFNSTPLKAQRDEFLAAGPDTPIERKAHFTHEVVGAAAAYQAMKAFENHEVHKEGKPTHARAKEIIAGLASGFAVKMVEEKGLPFTSDTDAHKFKTSAQTSAAGDAKRALRESGYFEHNELDPVEADEKAGNKVM